MTISKGTNREGVRHHRVDLSEIRCHYVAAGDSTAAATVLLLHGWPQTWFEWRTVIEPLAAGYRVIAPDLRGLGDTSRPSAGYDKHRIAGDMVELLDHLGIARAHVVGHDWGAAVAYALAATWRHRATSLTFIENLVPGFGLEDAVQVVPPSGGIRHFAFHMLTDVPEFLVHGRERQYLDWLYRENAYDPSAIDAHALEEYLRCYSAPGAMRAGFNYHRALYDDVDYNRRIAQSKLTIPVLAIGGVASAGAAVGDSLRAVADDVRHEVVPECGHWVPEEQPQWLAERLTSFFAKTSAR